MNVLFQARAFEQYGEWQRLDRGGLAKVNHLIAECRRRPFVGIGKPEPLRSDYSGWWSRRIDREHRLVYRVEGDRLIIVQCRYHY
ncbi:MAG: Txe/YoeB family addiction module toxin [Paracoccaceae bacterium]